MKRYSVIFSNDAVDDLSSSIQWGCENWGEDRTWAWYRKTRDRIINNLSAMPLSYPISPDNEEYEVDVRQMMIGRYRVLFSVGRKEVTILHLKGPYSGKN